MAQDSPRPTSSGLRSSPSARRHHRPQRNGKAGNRNFKKARDVHSFFSDSKNERKICLFCQWDHLYLFIWSSLSNFFLTDSQQHESNPKVDVASYSNTTSTTVMRKHLAENHLSAWVDGCDRLNIKISASRNIQKDIDSFRWQTQNQPLGETDEEANPSRAQYSPEAFVDAIMEFIVADDQVCFLWSLHSSIYSNMFYQSLNVIESPELRKIFLMLRHELRDNDIPHRSTMRARILEVLEDHLSGLEKQTKVRSNHHPHCLPHIPWYLQSSLGKISCTMDMWSDPNLTPFMAVTAHWIETTPIQTPRGQQYMLKLRADLIGFQRVPGNHTGEHLAHAFLHVLDRIGIASKVRFNGNAVSRRSCFCLFKFLSNRSGGLHWIMHLTMIHLW